MSELKFDPKNYRIHTDQNKRIIKKSLQDCGAGRSVLVDKDNVLIAGNGVYEQAQELGLKVRIVESHGEELIVVKRTDLSSDDEKRKLLALADNHASDTSMFDMEAVLEDFTTDDLDLWEFSSDEIEIDKGEKEITGDFNDKGIDSQSQYGVIIMCKDESEQEAVFNKLNEMGYNCKVVVT